MYKAIYHKLYKGYNIAKYDQLPAGKLNEALVFLGLNNIQLSPQTEFPEHNIITMTQAELLAHDEQVASEAVKRVQGELVNESQPSSTTLTISTNPDTLFRRRLVTETRGAVTVWELSKDVLVHTKAEWFGMANDAYIMIERSKLDEMTAKQLGVLLA